MGGTEGNTLPTLESVATKLASTPPSLFAADEVRAVFAELALQTQDLADLEARCERVYNWLGKALRDAKGIDNALGLVEDSYDELAAVVTGVVRRSTPSC